MYTKTISPPLTSGFLALAASCLLGLPLLAQQRGDNLEDNVISEIDQELRKENMDNNTAGLEPTGKPAKPDTALDVLDDTDNAAVAKATSGRMKDAAIFSVNPDVDKVAGAYLRESSDPMLTFDGFRFNQGKGFPPPWISPRGKPAFGTKVMLDLGRVSKPSLCLTYARTFTQSAVGLSEIELYE